MKGSEMLKIKDMEKANNIEWIVESSKDIDKMIKRMEKED